MQGNPDLSRGEVAWWKKNRQSREHQQHFQAQNLKIQIEKEPDNPERLRIGVNGKDILDWFREKHREFLQMIGINVKQTPRESKGIKM